MSMVCEKAAASDLDTCRRIMDRIYGENPSYWPFGLSADMMSKGGVYLVKDAASGSPAGFVGWQEFQEGRKKVGYYSIGILPEFRQRGLARSAVGQVLAEKAAGVDEVRALIREGNVPSLALAESLDIPVEKVAMSKVLGFLKHPGLHGTMTGVGMDVLMNTKGEPLNDPDTWKDYASGLKDMSALRLVNMLANIGFGAAGSAGVAGASGAKEKALAAGGAAGNIIMKDLALQGVGLLPKYVDAEADKAKALRHLSGAAKPLATTIGLLGLGGLGLAAYKAFGPRKKDEAQAVPQGRIRVTLPTRDPNDQETQIDLPFDADSVGISNALQGQLSRDVRRRLLEETRHRTRRRVPRENRFF